MAVIGASGARSRRSTGLVVEDGVTETPPMPQQTGGQPALGTRVSKRKVFFGGLRKAVFSYRLASGSPLDVTVNLIRLADGAVVQTWQQPQVGPGSVRRVVWDGRTAGQAQPEGYYTFQAVVPTAGVAAVQPARPGSPDAFALYGHMFPVRGKHDFGGAAARFGAGRTGHTHQGQDVLASCGTPLVAARAGRVVYKGFHSAAGYYLVISGSGTNQGYVYMHLKRARPGGTNERVYTGQQIGEVGRDRRCHGLPSALRTLVGTRLVQGRPPARPAARAAALGRRQLAGGRRESTRASAARFSAWFGYLGATRHAGEHRAR